tara:strand:+ start:166 stop:717 length:552 start_codon:yes stop_codon:yes gene_type:complete
VCKNSPALRFFEAFELSPFLFEFYFHIQPDATTATTHHKLCKACAWVEAMPSASCGGACRLEIARVMCAELTLSPPTPHTTASTRLLHAELFRPWLHERRELLSREFGCGEGGGEGPPEVRGKAVENGKSGMGFLVGGGDGVYPERSESYTVLFKQVCFSHSHPFLDATVSHSSSVSPKTSAI